MYTSKVLTHKFVEHSFIISIINKLLDVGIFRFIIFLHSTNPYNSVDPAPPSIVQDMIGDRDVKAGMHFLMKLVHCLKDTGIQRHVQYG